MLVPAPACPCPGGGPARYLAGVAIEDAELLGRGQSLPVERAVDIYTDGACSGNPGPGGWGALLRYGTHEKELYGGEANATTNNRMELTAPIRALESLNRPVIVRIHTDSTYVRNGITGWVHGWKRNGWKTKAGEPVKNV